MTTKEDSTDSGERMPLARVMREVLGQMAELLQCEPAGVSAVEATDRGWRAHVEMVELPRVPDTTSVMASYRVDTNSNGEVLGYERVRRYSRGQVDR
jgi:hypothetical protein